MSEQKIKVIITMVGLDGHTTGAEVISRVLRDAGMEVVYLGVNQTPGMIVNAAIQEDVDIIGISAHASNYSLIEDVISLLRGSGVHDVPIVVGGNVPRHTITDLKAKGIAEVFAPGATGDEIINYIRANARAQNERAA
ncbi:MAG: cobalamin B12-binding domain-containing protein [Xanthobacteraceae bacterium]|nr:MAG: cobalamin B12-binding domain-containing protein [Xanthobacteraceae bacterium]